MMKHRAHGLGRGHRPCLGLALLGSALASTAMLSSAQASSYTRLDAAIAGQVRAFAQDPLSSDQGHIAASLAASGEWYVEWARGDYSVTVSPFARLDFADNDRSHLDLREFQAQAVFGALEVRAGLSRTFWGKTEFLHLVDIINQDDALENIDGEDKLGQPMLRLAWSEGPVSLHGYILPGFRERAFPGPEGRLRAPLPVNADKASYQSSRKKEHVDFAARLQGYQGALDYGLAWFKGTSREPQLLPSDFASTPTGPQATELAPYYGQIEQLSLDAQYTVASWLFKLEAVWRDQTRTEADANGRPSLRQHRDTAATGGVEYTRYGILDSAYDVGYLAEYLWDERDAGGDASFQNDLFLATRVAANDVKDTTLLGGVVVDLDQGHLFASIEASRRLNGSSKLELEIRLFNRITPSDPALYALRRDDYLQLEYIRYF